MLVWGSSFALSDKVITCYGYGGQPYENNARCPGSNACCGIDATCLSNRLCHKPNDGPNTFVRGPCAIDPYDSGTCAQICLYNETTGILPRVSICADGSLCCNDDAHCCDEGNGIFLDNDGKIAESAPSTTYSYGPERTAATFRVSQETATSSTDSTTSATSTTALTSSVSLTRALSASSATASADSEKSNDKTSGLAIGLGVGLPVACISVGLIGAWMWWKKRKTQASEAAAMNGQMEKDMPQNLPQVTQGGMHSTVNYELSTEVPPIELDGGNTR
ncbi:hypothetical protein BGZ63DRAFT_367086 [Mariannaea sp. PMI_226]|nr:hypothetical protein BGZ63DRAFT_367086 [Mariannaea sp. PMI_226]